MEIWKAIEGYPNYEVSSFGRVRNKITSRVLSQEIGTEGYPTIRIFNVEGKRKHKNVHIFVARAFLGAPSECVNHKDGDKTNNNVDNLEWCTYSQNNQHAYDHKLKKARGLTSEEAKQLRAKVDNSRICRPVVDLTTSKVYMAIRDTAKDGFNPRNVSQVCSGVKKTHKGHMFAYKEKGETK